MDLGLCDKIAKYIIRPPRTTYDIQDLGPQLFQYHSKIYQRLDFQVLNQRKLKLQCSLFIEKHQVKNRSTIIFLHANSSSRLAVKNYISDLIPFFNIACLDCAGSGISEGSYVTLGYYEKQDLHSFIQYLKKQFHLSKFILWGRSMGAVTSLLYASKYGHIQAVVSDNAFSDLEQTCKQLKQNFFSVLPDFILDSLLDSTQEYMDQQYLKKQKMDFNIKKLKPKNVVNKIICPIFYIYSQQDKIVNNKHSKILYDLSNYPKRILSVKGDHNGHRDNDIKGNVIDYLLQMGIKNNTSQILNLQTGSQIQSKQNQSQYQSPFDKDLCKSYLKNSNNKNLNINIKPKNIHQINNKFDSHDYSPSSMRKIQHSNKVKRSYLSQTKISNQDEYRIQSVEFGKTFESCIQTCKNQRKRKKIFSKY